MARVGSDMREKVIAAARATVQARGYTALSFREIAKEVGIKSASVHYHFPTKGDLGAAVARRYTEDGMAHLSSLTSASGDPTWCMDRYVEVFRSALVDDNRMCLCGIMSAELDELPIQVRTEVDRFARANVEWIEGVLSRADPRTDGDSRREHAMAMFAAIEGAQLVARGCEDIALFDNAIRVYRATRLIP